MKTGVTFAALIAGTFALLSHPAIGRCLLPVYWANSFHIFTFDHYTDRSRNPFYPGNKILWRQANGLGIRETGMNPSKVFVEGRAGTGMFFGQHTRIMLDVYALCDPLLARLPTYIKKPSYQGHLMRAIPEGYLHARETGDVSQMNPALAKYYQKLRLVTSGDLFSFDRLKAIAGFQFGLYDHWLNDYLASRLKRKQGRNHKHIA